MKYAYFEKSGLDKTFYEEKILPRLPREVYDVHTHVNLEQHVKDVPKERIMDDWAFQCGYVMSAQDARYYFDTMFPGIDYKINAFPFPIREADIEASNEYIAQCIREGTIRSGFLCIKPEYGVDYLEKMLTENGYSGIKPYPDMVSGKKGAEVGIFDFMPREQFALAEKLGKVVMMHLPRAGRMPDDRNIAELKEIRREFPNLKLCIAHFGRCFTPYHFGQAIEKMGEDIHWLYFDTAAVLNPTVYELALKKLSPERILFGTDEPIFLWHGKRTWTKTAYQNLAREDFAWNTHTEGTEAEAGYTFYVYEQVNNILDTIDKLGLGAQTAGQIFGGNAKKLLGE